MQVIEKRAGSDNAAAFYCAVFFVSYSLQSQPGQQVQRQTVKRQKKPVQIKHILRWLRLAGMKILTISQVRTETGVVMAMSMSRRCLPILAGIMIM